MGVPTSPADRERRECRRRTLGPNTRPPGPASRSPTRPVTREPRPLGPKGHLAPLRWGKGVCVWTTSPSQPTVACPSGSAKAHAGLRDGPFDGARPLVPIRPPGPFGCGRCPPTRTFEPGAPTGRTSPRKVRRQGSTLSFPTRAEEWMESLGAAGGAQKHLTSSGPADP